MAVPSVLCWSLPQFQSGGFYVCNFINQNKLDLNAKNNSYSAVPLFACLEYVETFIETFLLKDHIF